MDGGQPDDRSIDGAISESKRLKKQRNELRLLLKESRDQLVLCTLIDKSGQCVEMVSKIDSYLKSKRL